WRFRLPKLPSPLEGEGGGASPPGGGAATPHPNPPPQGGRVYEVFTDLFAGEQRIDLASLGGDFVVWKTAGTPAYQLAVVVDDAEMGVTEVVRGDDLIPSTPRQLLLYSALGLTAPAFAH